jgi:hypothetical protein
MACPKAEPISHAKVVSDFVKLIWDSNLPDLRKAKATGIVLERLFGMAARLKITSEVYAALRPVFRRYLRLWAGPFFMTSRATYIETMILEVHLP